MRDVLERIKREAEWCAEDGALNRAQRQAQEDLRAAAEGRRARRLDATPRQRAAAELKRALAKMKARTT